MFKNKIALLVCAGLASVPMVASAAWTGKGEAGAALSTTSNGASSTTFAGKFDLASEVDKWKHAFGASTVYTSSKAEASAANPNPDSQTAANRWELHEQTDYKLVDHAFLFGGIRYENDKIGSYRYQAALAAGLGYKFIENDSTKLTAELGVGYKHFKPQSPTGASSDGDAISTGLVDLRQVLSPNTVLLDKLSFESGSSNTLFQNDLAVQVKMTDVLALSVGHQIRYNTKPLHSSYSGREYAHTDRLLTANLVYEFK